MINFQEMIKDRLFDLRLKYGKGLPLPELLEKMKELRRNKEYIYLNNFSSWSKNTSDEHVENMKKLDKDIKFLEKHLGGI